MKPYFSHDEGARNDPKLMRVLMRLGQAGKGVYWDLVEMLHEQGGYLPLGDLESMAFGLRTDLGSLTSLLNDFGLFSQDAERFWSETALTRLQMRNAKAEARAAAGAKGGKAKAEREAAAKALLEQQDSIASTSSSNATALPAETLASKEKESKEKEINTSSLQSEVETPPEEMEVVEPLSKGPTIAPQTEGGRADVATRKLAKRIAKLEPSHFAAFWQAYPRHDDRASALAAFRKLDEADQEAAAQRAVDWFVARPDIVSARGDFRPHPATWLNKRRWTDTPPGQLPAPAQQPYRQQQQPVSQVDHRQTVIEQARAMLRNQPTG